MERAVMVALDGGAQCPWALWEGNKQRGTSNYLTGSQDVLPPQLGVTYRVTPTEPLRQRLALEAASGPCRALSADAWDQEASLASHFQAVGF